MSIFSTVPANAAVNANCAKQSQFPKSKMNVTLFFTMDYESKSTSGVQKDKANFCIRSSVRRL